MNDKIERTRLFQRVDRALGLDAICDKDPVPLLPSNKKNSARKGKCILVLGLHPEFSYSGEIETETRGYSALISKCCRLPLGKLIDHDEVSVAQQRVSTYIRTSKVPRLNKLAVACLAGETKMKWI